MKAESTSDPIRAAIETAGASMMMIVPAPMWESLIIQGKHEGRAPGDILSDAVSEYMTAKGCADVAIYLHAVARVSR